MTGEGRGARRPLERLSDIVTDAIRTERPEEGLLRLDREMEILAKDLRSLDLERLRLLVDQLRALLLEAMGETKAAWRTREKLLERARDPSLHPTREGRNIFLARQLAWMAERDARSDRPQQARERLEELGELDSELLLTADTVQAILDTAVELWKRAEDDLAPGERRLYDRLQLVRGVRERSDPTASLPARTAAERLAAGPTGEDPTASLR